jgi:DNA-binding transcriptional MerR regulator
MVDTENSAMGSDHFSREASTENISSARVTVGQQYKSREAFRTISEVATDLNIQQHVLRFWETKFSQVRPLKRGGGRRYYRPEDVEFLKRIRDLLYVEGYTIKGVQKLLRAQGKKAVMQDVLPEPQNSNQPSVQKASSLSSAPLIASRPAPVSPASTEHASTQGASSLNPQQQKAFADMLAELKSLRALINREE